MDKENLMDSWINHIAPSSGCSISIPTKSSTAGFLP
jgi:hypothetical protein